MPIYEYSCSNDAGCDYCRYRFSVLQKLADEPLTQCPRCHGPVRRLISSPHVVAGQAHRLKESNIEKAGFTQYKKIGKGVYEKTAGKGPGIISDD
ncbi:MAG: zinc ribbon domain-containing protein [Wenzhouxiangella sp.]|jgi:putative FmdB family regulatory protein|nr:zinc ribbon domain-containing protein [Wenzhouxiangella sp.]